MPFCGVEALPSHGICWLCIAFNFFLGLPRSELKNAFYQLAKAVIRPGSRERPRSLPETPCKSKVVTVGSFQDASLAADMAFSSSSTEVADQRHASAAQHVSLDMKPPIVVVVVVVVGGGVVVVVIVRVVIGISPQD